jgi:hypothetical protein
MGVIDNLFFAILYKLRYEWIIVINKRAI